jgi:HEAT repeat protein
MTERWPGQSSRFAIIAIRGCDAQPEALLALIFIATNRSKALPIRQFAMNAVASLHYVENYESWVVPAILPYLEEENMARSTITALGSFRMPPEIGVPVMRKAAGSTSAEVRVWAIVSLGRYGKEASPAIPELLRALNDYDLRVQQEAADALKVVAPEARDF